MIGIAPVRSDVKEPHPNRKRSKSAMIAFDATGDSACLPTAVCPAARYREKLMIALGRCGRLSRSWYARSNSASV